MYGFTEKVIEFMQKSVGCYRNSLRIERRTLIAEEDFIKVDDTWLKLAKMMIGQLRSDFWR